MKSAGPYGTAIEENTLLITGGIAGFLRRPPGLDRGTDLGLGGRAHHKLLFHRLGRDRLNSFGRRLGFRGFNLCPPGFLRGGNFGASGCAHPLFFGGLGGLGCNGSGFGAGNGGQLLFKRRNPVF